MTLHCRLIMVSVFMLIVQTQIANAQNLKFTNDYSYIALGDSYTIGESVDISKRWPKLLTDTLAQLGYSNDSLIYIAKTGWRTDQLQSAIENANLKNDFDLVSLLIGVNNQYQGRSIETYEIEFRALIFRAIELARGDKNKVFVLSIPDYAYTPFGQSGSNPSEISLELDSFNIINKYIVDSLNICYFDITAISRMGLDNSGLVANDGLHPSGLQYQLWVNRIIQNVLKIEEHSVDSSKYFYPNPAKNQIIFTKEVNLAWIYDEKGELVSKANNKRHIVELPAGVYSIHLQLQSGKTLKDKIIIN